MSVVIEMIYTENIDFVKYANSKPKNLVWSKKDHAQILVTGSYQKEDYTQSHQSILVPFTGLNGLDLDFIKSKGINVFNTQVHSRYVAERALALILTLLGHIIPFDQRLRHGDWSNRNNENRMPWGSLFEKRIGFFGYGAINQHLHQLLKPFKVKVNIINRGKDFGDVEKVKDLDQLIKQSDIVVIAAPLNKETEGIFDSKLLSQMTDKFLINVGRGPIVDEAALYQALKTQTLKGFASDVWFDYPKGDEFKTPSITPLESFQNVVMTPHNGGFSEPAMDDRFEDIYNQIIQILEGDLNRVLKI